MAECDQFSAGGVLLHHLQGERCLCMIRRDRYGKSVWCLPKGHIELGEDCATAALREVYEETGIRGEILRELAVIRYRFRLDAQGAWCNKQVTFFLMRTDEDELNPRDLTEVAEARWVPLDEAVRLAGYDNEREVISSAAALIENGSFR